MGDVAAVDVVFAGVDDDGAGDRQLLADEAAARSASCLPVVMMPRRSVRSFLYCCLLRRSLVGGISALRADTSTGRSSAAASEHLPELALRRTTNVARWDPGPLAAIVEWGGRQWQSSALTCSAVLNSSICRASSFS